MRFVTSLRSVTSGLLLASTVISTAQDDAVIEPIPIAEVSREDPVRFSDEIYPLLKKNCIACHNSSSAKGNLNLESPQAMIAGGNEGPAIVPGKSDESLLLLLASHADDPIMPPERNRSNAVPFLPEELGLIKRWIDEGAKGEVIAAVETPTEWRHPPIENQPIYRASISPDARFAAAARANRIHLYDLDRGERCASLSDPSLAADPLYQGEAVAHRDFVQSLAFSPSGWLASGGYRTVKLWQRVSAEQSSLTPMPDVVSAIAQASDGAFTAMGDRAGNVRVSCSDSAEEGWQIKAHEGEITGLAFTPDGRRVISTSLDKRICVWTLDEGKVEMVLINPGPIHSMAFLVGLKQIAAGTDDGTVQLWTVPDEGETAPESPVNALKAHDQTVAAMSSVGGSENLLLTGGGEGRLKLWKIDEQQVMQTMEHGAPIADVAASPDGKRLASVGGNLGKLWNRESGELIADMSADPQALATQQAAERRASVATKLKALRENRIAEAEKAWSAEVEKAKEAAKALEKAREAQKALDLGRHEAAMAQQKLVERIAAEEAEREMASAEMAAIEGSLSGIDGRIAEVRDRVQAALAQKDKERTDLEQQLEVAKSRQGEVETTLHRQVERRTEFVAILHQLKATEGKDEPLESMEQALGSIEKLIAEVESQHAQTVESRQLIAQEQESLRQNLARIETEKQSFEKPLIDIRQEKETLQAKSQIQREIIGSIEGNREALAASLKQAEEALAVTDTAVEQGRKAVTDADQNAQLAVRLAAEAGKVHAETLAAHAESEAAEVVSQEELAEASQKLAEAKPPVCVDFSPDSRTVALSAAGAVVTWNAQDGEALEWDEGVEQVPTVIHFDVQGALLAAYEDGSASKWSPSQAWKMKRSIGTNDDPSVLIDRVTALAFCPQGILLATGGGSPSRGGELKIWRVADGSLVFENKEAHTDTIAGMAFSPDGEYLATAGADRMVRVWQVSDGALVATFEGHVNHVLDVAWRADGQVLASCGADKVIKLWDFEKRTQVSTVDGFGKEITSVHFVSTGETLLSGAGDFAVRLGDQRLETGHYVHATDISADARRLIAGSQDGVLRVWRASDQVLLYEFNR